MNQSQKTMKMVLTGVMAALIIVMANVPFLGYIPLGVINATIIHVPVIIGAILLGPKMGVFLGLVFGVTSILKNTFSPNLTSFVFSPFYQLGETGGNFSSVIISLVPRMLIAISSYYVYQGMKRVGSGRFKDTIALAAAGVAGSLTNTLLVMNLIYIFFGESYLIAGGRAFDSVYGAILAIIIVNGVPEAIVAGILTAAICKVMLRFVK